ncbi:MAG: MBL fold metallo-hydrolase [Porticoccaceae bacterium]|nr:MBL fold metallo-hydrolase [Porticoccaceae bacterium]
MLSKSTCWFLCATVVLLAAPASSHEGSKVPAPSSFNELSTAFGWDLKNTAIASEKIRDGLFVLVGLGGNIAVNVGIDGVLIVDDQIPQMMPKVLAEITQLGGDGVDYAVNTHWHFDHADGNLALASSDAIIIAQANSRRMMQSNTLINLVGVSYLQPAYPDGALPTITFDDSLQLHFNGQQIDVMHFGAAHTTGDAAIIFRGSNAVHMGDVYNTAYPFIDAGNGGSIDGLIAFSRAVLEQIDENTLVIPGHGTVGQYADLKNYIDMLVEVRLKMLAMINQGANLNEVLAAKLTADWDAERGDSSLFINRTYMSLTHKLVDR